MQRLEGGCVPCVCSAAYPEYRMADSVLCVPRISAFGYMAVRADWICLCNGEAVLDNKQVRRPPACAISYMVPVCAVSQCGNIHSELTHSEILKL